MPRGTNVISSQKQKCVFNIQNMAKWFGKILCCTGLENFTNYYAQFHYKENEFSDFSQYLQANIETVHLPHTNPRRLSEVIFQLIIHYSTYRSELQTASLTKP